MSKTREEFLFPPPPPPDCPCQIHMAGTSYCDGSYVIERRRENATDWVFEFVERGYGTLTVEQETCHPAAGDLYLAPARTNHRYASSADNPWTKLWINVSGPLPGTLVSMFGLDGVIHVPNFSRPELFKELHHRLRRHPEAAHHRIGPEFLTALVTTAAADRAASCQPHRTPEGKLLRSRLDSLIFSPTPSLEEMAQWISRSKVQTIRIFKRDFEETPAQYLLNRKLDAARELLRTTPKTIKEVAALLHFSDEYYFASLFKRKTGLAPGRYRGNQAVGSPFEKLQ